MMMQLCVYQLRRQKFEIKNLETKYAKSVYLKIDLSLDLLRWFG